MVVYSFPDLFRKSGKQLSELQSLVEDITGNELDGQHNFFTSWLDLGFREEKAISALVTKFKGKGVFDALIVGPVFRTT